MPKTSSILAVLPRDALRHLLDRHELRADDARKTDSMVRALSRGLPAQRATWLSSLPVATLKSAVVALDVTPDGKGKAALVQALDAAPPVKKAKAASPRASARAAAPSSKAATVAPKAKPKATPLSKKPVAPAESDSQARSKKEAPRQKDQRAAAKSPEENAPSAPSHMLSWTEAVALATKRGQSAATMIGQPMSPGSGRKVRCDKCRAMLQVQDCQIHACDHSFIGKAGQKICAECMFERNNMSVDTFHERLLEDWQCPHCSADVPRI